MTVRSSAAALGRGLLLCAVVLSAFPICFLVLLFLHATILRTLQAGGLRLIPDIGVIVAVFAGLLWLGRRVRAQPHSRAIAPLAVAVVVVPMIVIGIRHELHVASDRSVYTRMLRDPVLAVRAPGARAADTSRTAPCAGDSGSGPHVGRDYDWSGTVSELFTFYSARVRGLGWRGVVRHHVPSAGGGFEVLNATRRVEGYNLDLAVRMPTAGTGYSVDIYATPRQDCLLPLS